ncbi:MAG: SpaA isopeptide-forming pilin-related protein, partial [Oscillospiraceae bacterium]
VADLLVITSDNGAEIPSDTPATFTYKSIVTNPVIYADNGNHVVYNTASLFNKNNITLQAKGTISCNGKMLMKNMLPRTATSDLSNMANVNAIGNGGNAFDYRDKSIVFRLHINASDLKDATKDFTGVDGGTLGELTVSDTLPTGWEFKPFTENGKDYYKLYSGNGSTSTGFVTATDAVANSTGILRSTAPTGDTISFTFSSLTQPYVILVKAGPTDAVLKGYFDENKTTSNIRNNAVIKAGNTALASDYEAFSITGKILNKNFTATKDGNVDQYVTWSVDYTPCELEHTGENLHLEDTIPKGLDLRADSKGKIIVKDNIKAEKLTLNADGSYTGSNKFIELPETVLSYKSDTRILSFTMPDKKQAYRLTYITEITGEAGKLTNAVRLVGDKEYAPTEGKKEYEVSAASASASLTRSGWLMINKQNEKSTALAGAEFALYAEDGTTVIRQGVSKADGKLYLKIIPEGEYKLKETKAPTGYTPDTTVHTVKVEKQSDGKLQTTIDGTPGNEITLKNYKP